MTGSNGPISLFAAAGCLEAFISLSCTINHAGYLLVRRSAVADVAADSVGLGMDKWFVRLILPLKISLLIEHTALLTRKAKSLNHAVS
jgi:hypothetical protein